MQSIENKLFYVIKGTGRGYVFSAADFSDRFNGATVDWVLSNLVLQNKIRRVMRGIYDFPKYSELLGQYLSPEIEEVAHALARKFKWRIEPSGDTALYLLGLSTQVPARYAYFSDGPKREYDVLGNQLEFKKIVLKNIGFKYAESALLVQAIKSLGKDNISAEIIAKLQQQIDSKLYPKIIKDTKTVTDWVYNIIKQVCHEPAQRWSDYHD